MSRVLHLYTLSYPYGMGEGFIEMELDYLAKRFERIYIHPWNVSKDTPRSVPDNVSIVFIEANGKASFFRKLRMTLPYLSISSFRSRWRYEMVHAGRLISMASAVERNVHAMDSVHYSYWLSDWATVLGLVHQQRQELEYSARAHGFDVYDERTSHGAHLYRPIQLCGLKRLYTISNLAKAYLRKRNPDLDCDVQYLGTQDHGLGRQDTSDVLRVVSCSTISELKRVTSIPKLLDSIGRPVHWTHIGDGPLMEDLREILNSCEGRLKVDLKGALSPSDVMKVYKESAFDVFLQLSSSEGIPVSMMEAISFGIPILATDVGAVKEIVNDRTGVLLNPSSSIKEWVEKLESSIDRLPKRESVRQFWEDNFMAEKNYPIFAQKLYES